MILIKSKNKKSIIRNLFQDLLLESHDLTDPETSSG